MKYLKLISMAFLSVAIIFGSCSKEGAVGPAGPAGEQGPKGETGANGPKGDKGTANVTYSEWFSSGSQWTGYGTPYAYFDKDVPEITQEIYEHGDVRVYWKASNGAEPLPAYSGNPGAIRIFNYLIVKDNFPLRIYMRNVDGSNVMPSLSNKFRYIVIPGGVKATAALKNINLSDYNAVAQVLGIRD